MSMWGGVIMFLCCFACINGNNRKQAVDSFHSEANLIRFNT